MREFQHKNCGVVWDGELTISVFPTSSHKKPFEITFDFQGEAGEVFDIAATMQYPLAFLREVAKSRTQDQSESYYRGDWPYPHAKPWEQGSWHKGKWIPKYGR